MPLLLGLLAAGLSGGAAAGGGPIPSDRALKRDITGELEPELEPLNMPGQSGRPDRGPVEPTAEPVNGFQILEGVASLPISTWRYHWEDPQVRHVGPMAQDWATTFGLGVNDTTIATVDASGVALVSIQALYQLIGELRQEVAVLHRQLNALTEKE